MKALVVYDSAYGNTEKIAQAIGGAIPGEVTVKRAGEVPADALDGVDLLVVGAPTQGGRATQPVQGFLNNLPETAVGGMKVAAFDTRIPAKWVKMFGYAAGRIAKSLEGKGGNLVAPPEPFFVRGKEGPLAEGEEERAAAWARIISK